VAGLGYSALFIITAAAHVLALFAAARMREADSSGVAVLRVGTELP
jgi:hypothetical protein